MPTGNIPYQFQSITELHRTLGLPAPLHPLVSLVDYSKITTNTEDLERGMVFNFYKVSYKHNLKGKLKYGQHYYDFDEGGLAFVAPNQLIRAMEGEADYSGYTLLFHPDFIRTNPMGMNIDKYSFFSYSASEALYISDKEKKVVFGIFENIESELNCNIDSFSQDVLISHIDLLLNYSKRFYSRQFITRKSAGNDLLDRFEKLMYNYFATGQPLANGLPAVQDMADQLNVSSHYLSDMLRTLTGQNTKQHIHGKLIEEAKNLLSTTGLTVAEIAYQLGFEHPQSFHKLFKQKTKVSPLDFRQSFN